IATYSGSDVTGNSENLTWKELNWEFLERYGDLNDYLNFPDHAVILAWKGLPDFRNAIHLTYSYPYASILLKKLKEDGVKNISIAGTCLEYGLQEGALSVNTETEPVTNYGLAKDLLRKFAFQLKGDLNIR